MPLLIAVGLAWAPASALAAGKPQTISFTSTAPSSAKVEGPTYTVSATATSGMAVEFSSAKPEHCEVSGATVKFIGAGPCEINANQKGGGEWEKAKQVTQTFEVAKGTQTVKFTSTPPAQPTVGGEYKATAQGGFGEAAVEVTVDAASSAVCERTASASGSATIRFIAAGTCTLDGKQAGSPNYEPAPQVQQAFIVKKTQSISVQLPKSTFAGTSYAAEAEATSHLPVTISSATESICTVSSETTITLVKQGTCNLNFNQAGNGEYEPAPQFTQTFAVSKGTLAQTITFTSLPPEPTLVGFNYKVEATGGGSGKPVTFSIDASSASLCTISGATVTFLAGGTCTIDANQEGTESYQPGFAQQQVLVTKNAQAVQFTSASPAPALVGGTYAVSATASPSGLPVRFSSATPSACTVSGATVTLVGGGTCTINAEQPGNGQWAPATPAQQSFAVMLVVTIGPKETGSTSNNKTVVTPDSNFKVVAASLSLANYSITFVEAVSDPGTFNWVLTFENGKFGVYGASTKAKKCKSGSLKLGGGCRPAHVLFGRGHEVVTAAGSVTFTVRPTKAGVAALRKAFKLAKGLPVTAHVTYQSIHGGSPVARVQSLIVKGKR
ncbi:MAG TPA: hypothetical protein VGX51_12175 [Solirubrobacteraceae bacterium]|nr:hypothetical protein [Solirubrobacteraceae bacterium]